MPQRLTEKGKSAALKVVVIQFGVVVLASLIALYWGFHSSWSLLCGGLISVIPSLLFTIKAFQHSGAQAARDVMRAFYFGEALKFLLTIVLFVIVLTLLPVVAVASLIGFILAVMAQLSSPAIIRTT
ncbi:MAG: ATP synthase subunit I [Kangiellaceae bacterium]|jgi:ATP synthase protein I|nr:ATP synthase subunit I [Kangiellaceae bacterium]